MLRSLITMSTTILVSLLLCLLVSLASSSADGSGGGGGGHGEDDAFRKHFCRHSNEYNAHIRNEVTLRSSMQTDIAREVQTYLSSWVVNVCTGAKARAALSDEERSKKDDELRELVSPFDLLLYRSSSQNVPKLKSCPLNEIRTLLTDGALSILPDTRRPTVDITLDILTLRRGNIPMKSRFKSPLVTLLRTESPAFMTPFVSYSTPEDLLNRRQCVASLLRAMFERIAPSQISYSTTYTGLPSIVWHYLIRDTMERARSFVSPEMLRLVIGTLQWRENRYEMFVTRTIRYSHMNAPEIIRVLFEAKRPNGRPALDPNYVNTFVSDIEEPKPIIFEAVRNPSRIPSLRVLLEFGASVDVVDSMGYTPLHTVTLDGREDILAVLFESESTTRYIGRWKTPMATPIYVAAQQGRVEIMNMWIHKLRDTAQDEKINVQTEFGSTALHAAVQSAIFPIKTTPKEYGPYVDVVRLLTDFDATNAELRDKNGQRPVDIVNAAPEGSSSVREELLKILGGVGDAAALRRHKPGSPSGVLSSSSV